MRMSQHGLIKTRSRNKHLKEKEEIKTITKSRTFKKDRKEEIAEIVEKKINLEKTEEVLSVGEEIVKDNKVKITVVLNLEVIVEIEEKVGEGTKGAIGRRVSIDVETEKLNTKEETIKKEITDLEVIEKVGIKEETGTEIIFKKDHMSNQLYK